mmetsp:Transcript_40706/g.122939  ORF Transcript_40706/g.122939 Transcript_40706/m.122939 type:complete len:200 (-) Transcript_40706:671-1270(-)
MYSKSGWRPPRPLPLLARVVEQSHSAAPGVPFTLANDSNSSWLPAPFPPKATINAAGSLCGNGKSFHASTSANAVARDSWSPASPSPAPKCDATKTRNSARKRSRSLRKHASFASRPCAARASSCDASISARRRAAQGPRTRTPGGNPSCGACGAGPELRGEPPSPSATPPPTSWLLTTSHPGPPQAALAKRPERSAKR